MSGYVEQNDEDVEKDVGEGKGEEWEEEAESTALTEEEEGMARRIFSWMDADGSGSASIEEFTVAIDEVPYSGQS